MLKKEPKETGQAGCMIVFCEFEQQFMLIQKAKEYGLNHYINLVFRKNYSAQVLKANMKVVGNCEYALLLYREKLPKFNNAGKMVFNCLDYQRDTETPKIHPTQKSIHVLKKLITMFTDIGDVVIDPCAGSGVTLLAAEMLGRKSYGFEIKKEYIASFENYMAQNIQTSIYHQELEQHKINKRLSQQEQVSI
jgi:site-specific DNA-methyltransferase (adenine-specific)